MWIKNYQNLVKFANNKVEVKYLSKIANWPVISKSKLHRSVKVEISNFNYSSVIRKMSEGTNSGVNGTAEDRSKCIFCKIVDGKEDNEIYYQDEQIVVFQDIKPAAKHHLLVVPREHIRDCKSLVPSQLGLLDRLVQVGTQVLQERVEKDGGGGNVAEIQKLMGFHWPPFHTVSHLHLHVIAPSEQMGFIARTIFRPGSLWFVTSDYVRDRLQKMSPNANST